MKPLPKTFFHQIAKLYYSQHILLTIREAIVPASGLKLLDAPCGTGTLHDICMPCSYYGIDIDQQRVAECKNNFPGGNISVADASNLNFSDNYFDRILAAGLFHHVNEAGANKILGEFARILKPSGRLVVFDAIWPTKYYNIVGWAGRKIDQGNYVRHTHEYVPMFEQWFGIINMSCPSRLGFDYILAVLQIKSV